MHEIVRSAIQTILEDNLPFSDLKNKTVLVTGATGAIGRPLIKTLHELNKNLSLNLTVIVYSRRPDLAIDLFQDISENILYINALKDCVYPADFVIHLASPTQSTYFTTYPKETMQAIAQSAVEVLQYAERFSSRFLLMSTMEVYGSLLCENVTESDVGFLPITLLRNSYPLSKRWAELYTLACAEQKGLDVRILRPTLTFGERVDKNDNRLYAQCIRAILNHEDIHLATEGTNKRDYLYTFDCIHAILTVLLLGPSKEIYNISNPDSYCSIREFAETAASFSENTKVIVENEHTTIYPENVAIRLDNTKINNLHVFPRTSLEKMIESALVLTAIKE